MGKKVYARQMDKPNDIASEDDVIVGWDASGNKFMLVENFLDTRLHVMTRHFLANTDNFTIEVNRWKEGTTLVEACRALMEDELRLWVFPSADYAMSWMADRSDTIQHTPK